MLDLQKASSELFEVKWLDGSILRLQKPTRAMELSFLEMGSKEMNEKMAQALLYNLMFRVFGRREPMYVEKKGFLNKLTKRKDLLEITESEIEKIPLDALLTVLQEYFNFY